MGDSSQISFILMCMSLTICYGYGGAAYGNYYYDTPGDPAEDGVGMLMDVLPVSMDTTTVLHSSRVPDTVDRSNYRDYFKLGELKGEDSFDWRGSERHTEYTEKKNGLFTFDDNGRILSGLYAEMWDFVGNQKIMAQHEILYSALGNLLDEVKPLFEFYSDEDGDLRADVDSPENAEVVDLHGTLRDETEVNSFMGALSVKHSPTRRVLRERPDTSWMQHIKNGPSRRRLGRRLQAEEKQYVEITTKLYYTDLAFLIFGEDEEDVIMAVQNGHTWGNTAFNNSGVDDLKITLIDEVVKIPALAAEGHILDDLHDFAESLTAEERDMADVILLVAAPKEMRLGDQSLNGIALTIPFITDEGFDRAKAVIMVSTRALTTLTLVHELGHIMGLGHLAGTTDCAKFLGDPENVDDINDPEKWAPSTSCGQTIKCANRQITGGYRTVMAINSPKGMNNILPGDHGERFKCQDTRGPEQRVPYFAGKEVKYLADDGEEFVTGDDNADAVAGIRRALEVVPGYHVKVDCEGHWKPCTEACETADEREYIVDTPASGGGDECDMSGAVDCQFGEDECRPADVDCDGYWETCTDKCETSAERDFVVTQPKSGDGAECPAPGTGASCEPGQDDCPNGMVVTKGYPTSGHYDYKYQACSSPGGCETRIAAFTEQHGVRCCSSTYKPKNWWRNPGTDFWMRYGGTCIYHTYAGAGTHCKNLGARICTVEEIKTGATFSDCDILNYRLVWTSSTSAGEMFKREDGSFTPDWPYVPSLGTPEQAPSLSNAKYCLSYGDPHIYTFWEMKDAYGDGEKSMIEVPGKFKVTAVQALTYTPRTDRSVNTAFKVDFGGKQAEISATRWNIPVGQDEPFILSKITNEHFRNVASSHKQRWLARYPSMNHYMLTFRDFPELAIVWYNWYSGYWGLGVNVFVRYTGDWNRVVGQCMNPNIQMYFDCDDCDFGGQPMPDRADLPTCSALETCCSVFEHPFLQETCLSDHYGQCCEMNEGETCCGDYLPDRCPEDFECAAGERCNAQTGECVHLGTRRLLRL